MPWVDISTHIEKSCTQLSCKFCLNTDIRYNRKDLQKHLTIHDFQSKIEPSIQYFISQILNDLSAISNNTPIDYHQLQDILTLNYVMQQYTLGSLWDNFENYPDGNELLTSLRL